jgi:TonB family protein
MKPSLVLGSTDGSLMYRIQRLVGIRTQEYGPAKVSGVIALILGLAGLALNWTWANAQTPQQEKLVQSLNWVVEGRDSAGVSVNPGAANIRHRTAIEYPRSVIERGIQGTVSVEATIDATGNVVDARVLSGPPELRKSALQSVLEWHFEGSNPATQVVHIVFDAAVAKSRANERVELLRSKEVYERSAEVIEKLRRAELEQAKERHDLELARKTEAPEKEIAEMAAVVEKLKVAEAQFRVRTPTSAVDKVLSSIKFIGLSPEAERDLVARLPVRQGDTLTRQNIELMTAAIRQFDQHFERRFVFLDNGGVELQIIAP